MVVSGKQSGQRIALDKGPVVFGKNSPLPLDDDPAISGRHAQVYADAHSLVVADLGSTNGTFVNNQRISAPTRIADGDLLRFGNTIVKLRME